MQVDWALRLALGRRSSLALILIGALLIAVNSYSTLLTLYDLDLAFGLRWFLFLAYVGGIALVIFGVTFRVRSAELDPLPLLKPFFVAGLALLTVSVFCYILDMLTSILIMEYPFSLHSVLVAQLRKVWLSPVIWSAGIAGWLLLLVSRSAWVKSLGASDLSKVSHYALTLGAIIFSMTLSLALSESLFPREAEFPFYEPLPVILAYYAYVHPFGVLCMTFGWAAVASTHLKRFQFLLASIYAAFLVIMAVLFLIPI